MAKSCGIHIGQRRFEVVVLDGSAKKHKVVFQQSGDIPLGEDPITSTALAIKEATKGKKFPGENIGLAVDSGLAAYRTLSLPFDDHSKIEDVIKFEVESQLPQWDIDDVIVDFLTLNSTPGVESNLLVTAVPKDRLEARIRACERAGLEPYEAELDTTALFNAAQQAGILSDDGAQVLVHVGDASTSVVVVDGGQLNAMRAIHTGAGVTAPAPAEPSDDLLDDDEHEEREPAMNPAAIEQRRQEIARRLRRELGRTISAASTQNPIEAVYVTGLQLSGLMDEPIQEVPVRPFEGLPGADAADEGGACAVAYGAALRRLGGGVLKGTLRREELRYSGKFERLELPLAVLSLLLLTILGVQLLITKREIGWRGEGSLSTEWPWYVFWEKGERAPRKGDLQIWLEASNAFMFPNPDDEYPGRLSAPSDELVAYRKRAEAGLDEDRTKMEELLNIRRLLAIDIDRLKRELGQISEVEQPQSALEGLTLVLEVIDGLGEQVGRFGLRGMTANTSQGRSGQNDYVLVKLDVDFFANDDVVATRHYNDLANALEAERWCQDFERKPTKPIEGGQGIYADGITIQVDVSKAPKEEG